MTRIVAIGECMVEMAPSGTDPHGYRMGFAGDTMNTAWYLRRLLPEQFQVDYMTAVGSDAISGRMLEFMREAKLGTDHILVRTDRTVGLYMVQLRDGERSFSYWRSVSAARTLAADGDALAKALTGDGTAYFSGITIAILSYNDRQRLLNALADYRASGGSVVFDPNLRPLLWETSAEMTAAVMEAAAVSDTVLPSYEDEATWFDDVDPAATAKRYADKGARDVIVKNGPGQILAWSDGETSLHDPDVIANVIDTTAAGDSFNAGYLAGKLQGCSMAEAIRNGAALAARVVQDRGALVEDIG